MRCHGMPCVALRAAALLPLLCAAWGADLTLCDGVAPESACNTTDSTADPRSPPCVWDGDAGSCRAPDTTPYTTDTPPSPDAATASPSSTASPQQATPPPASSPPDTPGAEPPPPGNATSAADSTATATLAADPPAPTPAGQSGVSTPEPTLQPVRAAGSDEGNGVPIWVPIVIGCCCAAMICCAAVAAYYLCCRKKPAQPHPAETPAKELCGQSQVLQPPRRAQVSEQLEEPPPLPPRLFHDDTPRGLLTNFRSSAKQDALHTGWIDADPVGFVLDVPSVGVRTNPAMRQSRSNSPTPPPQPAMASMTSMSFGRGAGGTASWRTADLTSTSFNPRPPSSLRRPHQSSAVGSRRSLRR